MTTQNAVAPLFERLGVGVNDVSAYERSATRDANVIRTAWPSPVAADAATARRLKARTVNLSICDRFWSSGFVISLIDYLGAKILTFSGFGLTMPGLGIPGNG